MRSLVLFAIVAGATIGTAAHAGGGGGFHGGFHGGGGMGGGSHWGGGGRSVAIARSNSSSVSHSSSSSFSRGGRWGGSNWGGTGWHGGWHPGGGRGGWRHPGRPGNWGGHYRRPFRGWRLPGFFLDGDFFLNDWWDYGLPAPTDGYNWARYYDDAVLVDGNGTVADTRYGLNWNDGDYPAAGYGGDMGPGGPPMAGGPGGSGGRGGTNPFENAYSEGYDDGYHDGFGDGADSVTWGHRWSGGAMGIGGYAGSMTYGGEARTRVFSGPGGATTVVVHSPAVMTTTTTTTEEVSYTRARTWHAKPRPKRVWHKPACSCRCYCR